MIKDIKSVKVNFNLRETKPSDKETGVNCIVRYNNQRLVLTNIERVEPRYWNNEDQRARNTQKFISRANFNDRLDNIEATVKEVFRNYVNLNNSYPAIEQLRSLCKQALNKTDVVNAPIIDTSLNAFIKLYIEEMESGKRLNLKTGKPIAKNSIKIYNTLSKILLEYEQSRQIKIGVNDITLEFYKAFIEFMTVSKDYSSNTIGKHIRTLKTLLNEAFERKLTTQTDFKSRRFKTITEKSDTIYLNVDELETLKALDLTDQPRLERVRDLFLVGCWTGLRFSDFNRIDIKHFKGNFIEIETQKTGEQVVVPIHQTVKDIMSRYAGKTENSLPPAISNQKMNEYLKELCKEAKIETVEQFRITKGGKAIIKNIPKYELVSTHTARRSFSTNMYLMDIPAKTIMAITGHRTEQAFMKYIRVTPKGHAEKMQAVWNRQTIRAAV